MGISIEEYVYNDKGVEISSCSYNSLDPSSKFYTEQEVDEDGRVTAEIDERGEHKTSFTFDTIGNVRAEKLPNGSKFAYGHAKDGTVTAITHSTENGEENSTTKIYDGDLLTELKSGNNTVKYSYDEKQRVSAVELNGKSDYVSYSYDGEHTTKKYVSNRSLDYQ